MLAGHASISVLIKQRALCAVVIDPGQCVEALRANTFVFDSRTAICSACSILRHSCVDNEGDRCQKQANASLCRGRHPPSRTALSPTYTNRSTSRAVPRLVRRHCSVAVVDKLNSQKGNPHAASLSRLSIGIARRATAWSRYSSASTSAL